MSDIEAMRRWWRLMAILLAAGSLLVAGAASAEPEDTLQPSYAELESPGGKPGRRLDRYYTRIARLAVLVSALDVGAAIKGRTDVVWFGHVSVARGLRAVRGPTNVIVQRTTERADTETGHTRTIVTRWHISARGLESIEIEEVPAWNNGRHARRLVRSLRVGDRRFERVRAGIERALRREGVAL